MPDEKPDEKPGDEPLRPSVPWAVLDPAQARTGRALPTVYAADRVLLIGADAERYRDALNARVEPLGWFLEVDRSFGDGGRVVIPPNDGEQGGEEVVTRLKIVPLPGIAGITTPDAFTLVEAVRSEREPDPRVRDRRRRGLDTRDVDTGDLGNGGQPDVEVGGDASARADADLPRLALDHAVFLTTPVPSAPATGPTGSFSANPKGFYGTNGLGFYGTNPKGFYGTNGLASPADSYVLPGTGGRSPVAVVLPRPSRGPDPKRGRRPVVAIVDSGVGDHPWLRTGVKDITPLTISTLSAEADPGQYEPFDGVLDSVAGHGTFIAGIVRQVAPRADILSWRVVAGDGAVAESDLYDALHTLAVEIENGTYAVDVLSLSLGYYHERPWDDDGTVDLLLRPAIEAFSRAGVVVVMSAGNESTNRELSPARFAKDPAPGAPWFSVGARNPNGTLALFSNFGDWVTTWMTGAAMVSATPPFRGGLEPVARVDEEDDCGGVVKGRHRETLDPDDYRGHFAIWSGTSFAAPHLAARLVRAFDDAPEAWDAGFGTERAAKVWANLQGHLMHDPADCEEGLCPGPEADPGVDRGDA